MRVWACHEIDIDISLATAVNPLRLVGKVLWRGQANAVRGKAQRLDALRRAARNDGARFAIEREMARTPGLRVTLPNIADEELIKSVLK